MKRELRLAIDIFVDDLRECGMLGSRRCIVGLRRLTSGIYEISDFFSLS